MENAVVKFNDSRDKEEVIYNGVDKIVKKVNYGVIRLVGEKDLRRISWETFHKLKTLPPDYTGKVELRELGVTVPVNQIVFMEEREEQRTESTHLTDLPTTNVFLTTDYKLLPNNLTRKMLENSGKPYIEATVHYEIRNDQQCLILEPNKIKRALFMKPQPEGYPHAVSRVIEYGNELDLGGRR